MPVGGRGGDAAAGGARQTGSPSFQCMSTGAAMKIDEYAPDTTPIASAKAKSFSVSPPKNSSARIGINVHSEVASERVSTSLIERLMTCENAALGIRGTFSRMRSNTMIVS